jgi:hypothetical protein
MKRNETSELNDNELITRKAKKPQWRKNGKEEKDI